MSGTTRIADLPRLEDVESRTDTRMHNFVPNAGMRYQEPQMKETGPIRSKYSSHPNSGMAPMNEQPNFEEEEIMMPQQFDAMSIPCIEISNHVKNCPICSRFYNNDRTIYNIVIITLIVVCILLLKRVLNV